MTLERRQILRPCTIIPSELYVERAADRQLSRILNDMGRPGYVLVARQMGKTNLLLHARREMAGGPDAFVYVDVSNVVPDVRTFFRSVIDICLDSQPEKFAKATEVIEARRSSKRQLLEHKEHELELRDLLRDIEGRLVICLDEIDALTKTDYSDQVFSLIRSIYFSGRTNFDEFHRLTYVLSGVAEPTEIIKNRSISPFNIGEKIYLEDFSIEEFRIFLRQAQLNLSDEVAQRIYDWAGGNPRISWDVCAAIEAIESPITEDVVDAVVDSLYLRSFDLPPVDHIRTLASTDKEVRSAIMAIHYGKSDSVTDSVKSRLYLSGIISPPGPKSDLRIKNRVIEASLSEKWLEEIERGEQSILDQADQLFRDQQYLDALRAYERCEDEGVIGDADLFALRKGTCQYFTADYAGAIRTLTAQPFPKSRSVDFYVASRSRIANAHLLLGHFEESISAFEKLIGEFGTSGADQPLSFYDAKLNLSSAYLAISPPNTTRATELCESVISLVSSSGTDRETTTDMLERYRCLALYNICVASLKNGSGEAARAAMDEAIAHASRSDKATLMLERAREFRTGHDRVNAAIDCAEYCMLRRVAITGSPRAERPLAFSVARAASLILELELGGSRAAGALHRFLDFCRDPEVGHEVTVHRAILMAAGYAFTQQRSEAAVRLYGEGAQIPSPTNDEDYWSIFAFNLAVCPSEQVEHYSGKFADRIIEGGEPPKGVEIRATHRAVSALLATGQFERADQLLAAAGVNEFQLSEKEHNLDNLVYQYLRLSSDIALNRAENARVNARELYNAAASYSGNGSDVYSPSYAKHLAGQVMAMLPDEFAPKTVHRMAPKLGRNEIVSVRHENGSVEKGKYKRLEPFIRSGKAILIEEQ